MANKGPNSHIAITDSPSSSLVFNDRGFTMIEMLIIVVIIGILATLAMLGKDIIEKNRLTAASKEFYSDLQKLRMDAMTRTVAASGRGFGIKFGSNQSYTVFEFNDTDGDFAYDGSGEESSGIAKTLPVSVTVTIGAAGTPTGAGNVLIYDKRGMVRMSDWGLLAGGRVYVLNSSTVSDKRCISISSVSIREGIWNGAACNPS